MPSARWRCSVLVVYLLKGDEMLMSRIDPPSVSEKAELRIRTASTKVTEGEFAELESFASQHSQSVSEWIRPNAPQRGSEPAR
jgi:hypothetical protein